MVTSLRTTGSCYCGCGSEIAPGAYFRQGHDKKADADLNAIHHSDNVAQRIVDRGYGPTGRNLHEHAIELGVRERCGIDGCNVSGVPGSYGMRRHRASHQTGSPSPRASD
ncbi:MAG: hypothetical protein ACRDTG_23745 [Pseudonocardiaceae bacterium]